jgi:hypothetical protein
VKHGQFPDIVILLQLLDHSLKVWTEDVNLPFDDKEHLLPDIALVDDEVPR